MSEKIPATPKKTIRYIVKLNGIEIALCPTLTEARRMARYLKEPYFDPKVYDSRINPVRFDSPK